MRFKTEFQLTSDELSREASHGNNLRIYRKSKCESDLGKGISKLFGWQERGETTLHGPISERHTLEIEAFPMDKWIEFKKRFMDALPDYDTVSRTRLMLALDELESYSKPAGEAKELH